MSRDDDNLLDGCLAEVLGGRRPPDLRQKILAAWLERQASASSGSQVEAGAGSNLGVVTESPVFSPGDSVRSHVEPAPPPVHATLDAPVVQASGNRAASDEPMAPPVQLPVELRGGAAHRPDSARNRGAAAKASGRNSRSRSREVQLLGGVAAAVCIVGMVAGFAALAISNSRLGGDKGGAIAKNAATDTSGSKDRLSNDRLANDRLANDRPGNDQSSSGRKANERSTNERPGRVPGQNAVAGQAAGGSSGSRDTRPSNSGSNSKSDAKVAAGKSRDSASPGVPSGNEIAKSAGAPANAGAASKGASQANGNPSSSFPVNPNEGTMAANGGSTDAQLVALIDESLAELWRTKGVEPAAPAEDSEWCRRVYLRLIGRIPSVEEVDRFVATKAGDKRSRLVDELMTSSKYRDEYASHWADVWAKLLIGRSLGGGDATARLDGLVAYLRSAFRDNKPYDKLVYELISATGSAEPSANDYNGAVNFLIAHSNDKATQATGRVARVFLGQNVQCAQCHVHPSDEQIAQDRFWQLNAFFRQMKVERDKASGLTRLVNADFRGEGKDPEDAAVFFELGSGRLRAAYPVFVDGTELPHAGSVADVDRRTEFARLVAKSNELNKTLVNRLWSHFLGYGFTNPVDDIGPHSVATLPEVWDRLAKEFAARGHDMQAAQRWIVLSGAFGLSSRSQPGQLADSPENGGRPLFSRYYSRPMKAEELYKSLELLASAKKNGNGGPQTDVARRSWLAQLARQVGPDRVEDDQIVSRELPKSLIQMNGEFSHGLGGDSDGLLKRVVENEKMSVTQKIEHLFQAALSRKPTSRELKLAQELLATSPADQSTGLRDIWWVLLNSNEFQLDH